MAYTGVGTATNVYTSNGSAVGPSFQPSSASGAIMDVGTQTGTNPIAPTGAGLITINGATVAAGTNPVRTDGTGPNTMAVEVQMAQSIPATDATKIGLAAFSSAQFIVDSNGFTTLIGAGPTIQKVNVQTGTSPIVPSSGIITINGATVAAGTNPVRTDGTGANTLAVEVQKSQALAAADATKIGLSNFDSASFSVDANGFVTAASTGLIKTITGNSGGAETPSSGNFNILGTGSITVAGSANTETVQLTGLTNHAVLVGAGTATITKIGPSGSTGQILQNNAAADPSYSTATYPSVATSTGTILRADGTNWVHSTATFADTYTASNLLYSNGTNTVTGLATANQAVLTTGATGIPVLTALAVNGQLIIGSTAGVPAASTLSAGTGISITNGSNSITIAATGSEMVWTDEVLSFNAAAGNGYFIGSSGVVATLPASPSQGDKIAFFSDLSDVTSVVRVTANTGQTIQIGAAVSAAAGNANSKTRGDSLTIVYRASDTSWCATSVIGTWSVT